MYDQPVVGTKGVVEWMDMDLEFKIGGNDVRKEKKKPICFGGTRYTYDIYYVCIMYRS